MVHDWICRIFFVNGHHLLVSAWFLVLFFFVCLFFPIYSRSTWGTEQIYLLCNIVFEIQLAFPTDLPLFFSFIGSILSVAGVICLDHFSFVSLSFLVSMANKLSKQIHNGKKLFLLFNSCFFFFFEPHDQHKRIIILKPLKFIESQCVWGWQGPLSHSSPIPAQRHPGWCGQGNILATS